jgi:hypothetical protein
MYQRVIKADGYLDMVGVTGSIPVAPTIRLLENSALSKWVATLSGAPRGLNKPRTVPKCRGDVGNRRAPSSRMVLSLRTSDSVGTE